MSLEAHEEISRDGAVAAALSELDGVVALQEEETQKQPFLSGEQVFFFSNDRLWQEFR